MDSAGSTTLDQADPGRFVPAHEPLRQLRPSIDRVLARVLRIEPQVLQGTGVPWVALMARVEILRLVERVPTVQRLAEVANFNLLYRCFIGLPMGEIGALLGRVVEDAARPSGIPARLVAAVLADGEVRREMARLELTPEPEAVALALRAGRGRMRRLLAAAARGLFGAVTRIPRLLLRPIVLLLALPWRVLVRHAAHIQASRTGAPAQAPGRAAPAPAASPPPPPSPPARRRVRRLRRLARVSALFSLGLLLAAAAGGFWLDRDLPTNAQMADLLGRPTLTATIGEDGRLALHSPVFPIRVPLDSLPAHVEQTLLEMEDRRFRSHVGFDPIAIGRVIWDRIEAAARGGRVRAGGSTITQQLAKNVFLSDDHSLLRKLREIVVAFKLEWQLGKDEILELYLNSVYFGGDIYGIERAARHYFGIRANQLDRYRTAMLVGLLPSPNRRNPEADIETAHAHAARVLHTLESRDVIGRAELESLMGQHAGRPLAQLRAGDRQEPRVDFGYFRDWVAAEVRELDLEPGRRYRVVLTIDPLAQIYAQLAVSRVLAGGARLGVGEAAGLVLDPDGAVRAMVGGAAYARSQVNRTTTLRAPASTFKAFLHLAALESGLDAKSLVLDRPIRHDGRDWPRNFDGRYRGEVSLEDALVHSLNAASVRLAADVGNGRVIDVARRLGIGSVLRELPSLPLGTSEVSMLEMAAAYGSFASGGLRVRPYGLLAVRSDDGSIDYWRPPPSPERVAARADVEALNRMLRDVVARGTGRGASFQLAACGKTGTGVGYRDAWFIGFTGDRVAAIWAGNDDNSPMSGVTGGGLPASAWNNLMSNLSEHIDQRPAAPPPGLVR